MAEVWRQPPEENGNAAMEMATAKWMTTASGTLVAMAMAMMTVTATAMATAMAAAMEMATATAWQR